MNRYFLLLAPLLSFSVCVHASDVPTNTEAEPKIPGFSLSELAAEADLVALTQVKDTDYVYTRSFPSEGRAFLRVLIAYKPAKVIKDIVEVYERGLHPNECYFENPTVFEEGRRYLLFARLNPDDPESYRGLASGCALEVLVTADNRYALKYPVDGIMLEDDLEQLATRMNFHDSYALVSGESLSPAKRDQLLAGGFVIPYQDGFKYTHGIDLTTARKLIDAEALKSR